MKVESQWPAEENRRAAVTTSGSTMSWGMQTPYRCLRCGELRSPAVTEGRNGPLRLRDDDDGDALCPSTVQQLGRRRLLHGDLQLFTCTLHGLL